MRSAVCRFDLFLCVARLQNEIDDEKETGQRRRRRRHTRAFYSVECDLFSSTGCNCVKMQLQSIEIKINRMRWYRALDAIAMPHDSNYSFRMCGFRCDHWNSSYFRTPIFRRTATHTHIHTAVRSSVVNEIRNSRIDALMQEFYRAVPTISFNCNFVCTVQAAE